MSCAASALETYIVTKACLFSYKNQLVATFLFMSHGEERVFPGKMEGQCFIFAKAKLISSFGWRDIDFNVISLLTFHVRVRRGIREYMSPGHGRAGWWSPNLPLSSLHLF